MVGGGVGDDSGDDDVDDIGNFMAAIVIVGDDDGDRILLMKLMLVCFKYAF